MRTRIGAVAVLAALFAVAPAALAHQGNPNYLSQVNAITPRSAGVTVDVLNRDDRLLLHNTSGSDVLVRGYSGEPYGRVLADGTVQVNTDSPAYYLNDDRFADVKVPDSADGKGPPKWKELSKTGRFEWHDHRCHWMATTVPPAVKDQNARTKIFDWKVPIDIGDQTGAISGTLYWTPLPGGSAPLGMIFALAALIIVCCVAVFVVRRRRAAGTETAEAW